MTGQCLTDISTERPLPHSRLNGIIAGLRQVLPQVSDQKVVFLDGHGRFESSLSIMRRHLTRHKSSRVLLGAVNDPSCLGALQAYEETKHGECCLAVGQNASIEARQEMRRHGTRLLGSVGYFPEHYGEAVISLALDKAQGKELSTASFVKHQLITPLNVDSFYPNDKMLRGWQRFPTAQRALMAQAEERIRPFDGVQGFVCARSGSPPTMPRPSVPR